jgi:hypothetical protein
MAAGCKPAAPCGLRRFESSPVHQWAVVAQLVERVLGKDEVTGSIPVNGSRFFFQRLSFPKDIGFSRMAER